MTDTKKDAQGEEQQKPKAVRRLGEEDLAKKIDRNGNPVVFIAGSLRFVMPDLIEKDPRLAPYEGKQVVDKVCEGDYEDGQEPEVFIVATSDLHQCFHAEHNGMRKLMRNKRAKERREVAKAQREADAAELAGHRSEAEAQSA